MILGLGNDLIDIRRIDKSIAKYGERFLNRVYTDIERAKSDRRAGTPVGRAASYAKRFAAKEACAKALGTGLNHGVYWRDMVGLPPGRFTTPMSRQ